LDELVSVHDQDLTQVMQVGIWNICESFHMILEPSRPILHRVLKGAVITSFPFVRIRLYIIT
jgi:hypothetical protein